MSNDADLFADILEYRDVLAAIKEFGPGYNVAVERRWVLIGEVTYVVTITKRAPLKWAEYPEAAWHAHGTDVDFLTAVRNAVAQARANEASDGKLTTLGSAGSIGQHDLQDAGPEAELDPFN